MNSLGHLACSIVKSALRIAGCLLVLCGGVVQIGCVFFLAGEVLGIMEELVDKR